MLFKELISRNLICVEPTTKLTEVAKRMADQNIGSVLVLSENDKPRGIITDRDIVVRCIAKNLDVNDTTVEQVLTENLQFCHEDSPISEVIKKMHDSGVRRLPVVDRNGKAVGIVSFGAVLAALTEELAGVTSKEKKEKGEKMGKRPEVKAA